MPPTVLLKSLSYSRAAEIVDLLRAGPLTVNEITALMGISQPQCSHVLAILRRTGVVYSRRITGTTSREYRINENVLVSLGRWCTSSLQDNSTARR
ncbi:DNA-binding transcriptional regulator, ArsR family [Arthrobacter crystallopoietes]|uniref:DNA-binding transcriptional regulator, ArsR family n=1 Tax=Crystallibacter crystallopoietes TaxID=37928 RepID=A0A1H1BDV5_9MICC|nr:DNA-binding transcriptional regulator, ArsR family [Arthrobacter crystallopoietes]